MLLILNGEAATLTEPESIPPISKAKTAKAKSNALLYRGRPILNSIIIKSIRFNEGE